MYSSQYRCKHWSKYAVRTLTPDIWHLLVRRSWWPGGRMTMSILWPSPQFCGRGRQLKDWQYYRPDFYQALTNKQQKLSDQGRQSVAPPEAAFVSWAMRMLLRWGYFIHKSWHDESKSMMWWEQSERSSSGRGWVLCFCWVVLRCGVCSVVQCCPLQSPLSVSPRTPALQCPALSARVPQLWHRYCDP